MPYRPAFARPLFDKNRALPRMSWAPENLYNLWQRVSPDGPLRSETIFTRTSMTLFQQRWRSKRLSRGYHGDHIGEGKFERWYLPEALPSIHAEGAATGKAALKGGKPVKPSRETATLVAGRPSRDTSRALEERNRQESSSTTRTASNRVPVGTMLYKEIERRLDVLVFRACFATSVYQARQMVVHRKVKVNGRVEGNPNVRLGPGDLFEVEVAAVEMLQPPRRVDKVVAEVEKKQETDGESTESTDTAEASPTLTKPTEPTTTQPTPPTTTTTALAHFNLPAYASPHLFIPAYLEVNFKTCSAVYVRHPTARPGYSEIPSPYDADGEVMSLSWEWFKWRAPNMKKRRYRWMSPERQTDQK
ncbi:hypothetical protein QFC22_001753 [Naganishia vaughanmartiniae]|uniref:Uncharacterized protein n=1 Tax=Naganishia vaughanmartiniae TaxID=1424756 RepID=A0ACC2XEI6_9TREE|nr:hypothetical protein QFC22_001753 [Naganishia vaughanmartiniae]